ncbi:MAG TPA: hypothetical protein VF527_06355 [Pyrinomonadaceae bacterium]|jgi:hypothetical protein
MLSIIKTHLRRRWLRALVGGAVFVAVMLVQYKLADWPVAVDLADTGKFAPVTLRLGQEELIIEGPVVNSPEGVLLAHAGEPNEIVDIRFDNARLDDDTVNMLADLGSKPPTAPVQIKFSPRELDTKTGVDSDPCRTFVTAGWAQPASPPTELRFFQLETPGLDRFRHLEMQVTGGELLVNILPKSGESDDDAAAGAVATGCRNLLRAGDMEETIGEVGIAAIAASGSTFRWHFRPRMRGVYLWSGADGLFQPFILGQPQVSAANAPPPLQARAVRIRSLEAGRGGGGGGAAAQPELLSAQSTDGGALLSLSTLRVGSDQIQLNVSGNGWVKINGVDRSVNLFERLNNLSPLGALLFAALNGAFFEGIRRFIFGKPKTAEQPPADTN